MLVATTAPLQRPAGDKAMGIRETGPINNLGSAHPSDDLIRQSARQSQAGGSEPGSMDLGGQVINRSHCIHPITDNARILAIPYSQRL